jgi:hypothetical protein
MADQVKTEQMQLELIKAEFWNSADITMIDPTFLWIAWLDAGILTRDEVELCQHEATNCLKMAKLAEIMIKKNASFIKTFMEVLTTNEHGKSQQATTYIMAMIKRIKQRHGI